MDDRRLRYLQAMGIDMWLTRQPDPPAKTASVNRPLFAESLTGTAEDMPTAPGGDSVDVAALDWDTLRQQVLSCTACDLHRGRTQAVFGVGNPQAQWMIIGEAPGSEEDRKGEPFVGRAGKLLDAMMEAAGFQREQVYIANIVKCRPPDNRDPRPEEAEACAGYLARQITLVQPRVILAVGRVAAQKLLKTDRRLGALRGQAWAYPCGTQEIPVVVTYHPAYLLRSPQDKRKAWEDLKLGLRILRGDA